MLAAHIALFLANLIYAGNYSIAKEVMPEFMLPLGFILLRVTTGLLVFTAFHLLFIKEKVEKSDFPLLILCGIFGVAINQMFFFLGLNWTTPINASLIMTTTPMLVLVASALIIRERITWIKVIGILLGATGAILLIAQGQSVGITSQGIKGDLMVLVNATSYGIYLVLVKKLMKKYNPITIVRWVFTFGWLVVLPFGSRQLWQTDWSAFLTPTWIAVAYVLLCTTVLAYFFTAIALKSLNPTVASIYIYSQPVLATIIALCAGTDYLTVFKVLASMLIFAGVFLVSFNFEGRKKVGPA